MAQGNVRAETLIEALPHIQRYHGRTVIVKYGGAAMAAEDLSREVMRDIVLMSLVGIRPVVVHGGGPQVSQWMERLGAEPVFVDGRRVTDEQTLEVAEMVLAGTINKSIVGLLQSLGGRAVGLSGRDGGTIRARQFEDGALGFVGEVAEVDARLVLHLLEGDFVPVISSIAEGPGGSALNVNADSVAGALARVLAPCSLLLLSDVPGVLADANDEGSVISRLSASEAHAMLSGKSASKGMIPKLEACLTALEGEGNTVHLVDGRVPHSVLIEVLTDEGIGTMVVPD
jgi:acetylglutamate kinase